jgi:hypothetical protein
MDGTVKCKLPSTARSRSRVQFKKIEKKESVKSTHKGKIENVAGSHNGRYWKVQATVPISQHLFKQNSTYKQMVKIIRKVKF